MTLQCTCMFCIFETENFTKTLKIDAQHKEKQIENIFVLLVLLVDIFQPWELPMEQLNQALE